MSVENRPYVGTWQLNQRSVVRHTPDALVYVNGNLDIPGCPSCGGRIDLQRYITAVTVDPSTEPVAGASITMHIPRQVGQSFFRDGQFILQTGLEVNIYLRGYFPVKGSFGDLSPEVTGGIDVAGSVIYPYYHVFHGVVTEVSHEYSGGEHTASMSCSDMLHFWGYHRIATMGSMFGGRPEGSDVGGSVGQQKFTGDTPYAIIYSLYRDVMGSAGAVGQSLGGGSQSNVSASSTATGDSLWSMTSLYWEKRFSQHFNNLRMYGVDGTLYNAYTQAFLGKLSTADNDTLVKKFSNPNIKSTEHEFTQEILAAAREVGYDPVSTYTGAISEGDAAKGGLGLNVNQMQGFVSDISNVANINWYETEYQSKMEIISTLTELTGFEFFQDVDGDFMFKPPFYNMDTSSSRVYVVEDIDIISFSVSETEPEATAVKATATAGKNTEGLLGNDFDNRAVFVDYRLVAKYGWRESTFETAYYGDTRAMFFACINRMDLFNIRVRSATCQMPMRPELRPGYPVYVRYLDCFFYLQSFNHSFTFGGQCTTTMNLVGRRAKFHAPGRRPEDGNPPTVADIRLSEPWLPSLPLEVIGNDGIPRLQGFPNVVMAIDPELLNPNFYAVGFDLANLADAGQLSALIQRARQYGVLELWEGGGEILPETQWLTGPFQVRTSDNTAVKIGTYNELLTEAQNAQTAANELAEATGGGSATSALLNIAGQEAATEAQVSDLQQIIDAVRSVATPGISEADSKTNYLNMLGDLKSSFHPGGQVRGYYRYYSASHPEEDQQGMKQVEADEETSGTTQAGGLIGLENTEKVFGFQVDPEGHNILTDPASGGGIEVRTGLPIMRPNTQSEVGIRSVATPTQLIATIAFAEHRLNKEVQVSRLTSSRKASYSQKTQSKVMGPRFRSVANEVGGAPSTVRERFEPLYTEYVQLIGMLPDALTTIGVVDVPLFDDAVDTISIKVGVFVDPDLTVEDQYGSTKETKGVVAISEGLAAFLASLVSAVFKEEYANLKELYGNPGNNRSKGTLSSATPEDKADAYAQLDRTWATYIYAISGSDVSATPMNSDGTGLTVYVADNNAAPQYTPVFPVSDHAGYEVIGSYAYGRGLSIEPGGSFEQLQSEERFANVSIEAVDAFVTSLRSTGSPSKALGILAKNNPEAAAELAIAAGDAITEDGENAVDVLGVTIDGDLFNNQFRNYISSSKESTQKTDIVNAAWKLADLGLHSELEVCECKGAEADTLLLAFADQNFVSVDQPDDAAAWQADRMLEQGVAWKTSQDALRGAIQDGRTNVFSEMFQAAQNMDPPAEFRDLTNTVNTGGVQIQGTAVDVEQAAEDLADQVNDFADGED